ncbi:hypothetical protein glysoja_041320 [Glycine soja]|uniref:Uncharacterized protein n=1 Tax=Glycine soja TaxID=3848 RepID=A0A0B2SIV4_GLYSO|nr:hypothetical protein JHK87_024879 [Glycine soja]KHN46656.1 hypothetical protein glysoja_041320 [Glycine soja]
MAPNDCLSCFWPLSSIKVKKYLYLQLFVTVLMDRPIHDPLEKLLVAKDDSIISDCESGVSAGDTAPPFDRGLID